MAIPTAITTMQRFKSELFNLRRANEYSSCLNSIGAMTLGFIFLETLGMGKISTFHFMVSAGSSLGFNHLIDAAAITILGNNYRNNRTARAFLIGACSTSLATRVSLRIFKTLACGATERLIILNGMMFAFKFSQ